MEKPTSWVYFIQEGADGPIKIGFTTGDPSGRLSALQTGNPNPLRIVAATPGTMEDERRWHERFAHLRMLGEWFLPADDLLEAMPESVGPTEDNSERTRLDCGLDRTALQDIADFIEAQRLHGAAYRLTRAVRSIPELPPLSLAERLEALAGEIHSAYCGGGVGIDLFGRDLLSDRGHEAEALAKRIRDGHASKAAQEAN